MRPDQRETQVQAGVQPCSRGWGMRGARTRDGLLAQVPPSIVMSRSSGIALSDSRADLPRTTMLMPAHLRGAKQGDGLTGVSGAESGQKMGPSRPHLPIDRTSLWSRSTKIQFYPGHNPSLAEPNVGICGNMLPTATKRLTLTRPTPPSLCNHGAEQAQLPDYYRGVGPVVFKNT